VENASGTATAWSGNLRNGLNFSNRVTAYVVNPFIRLGGIEYFGNLEVGKGSALIATDPTMRTVRQYSNEVLYRFFGDMAYLGGRYNTVTGNLAGMKDRITQERTQFGGGWFVTPNVLAKAEWVNQLYNNFPTTDIRSGAKFKGFVIEGVVGF
jgi:hypothetical protein